MKKVYLGNRQLTTLATREEGGGGNDELAKSLIEGSITSVDIPSGTTQIKAGTFLNCSSLSRVTIPNGVKIIDTMAFGNCKSLGDIVIPSSVEYLKGPDIASPIEGAIRSLAFADCSSLSDVTIKSPTKMVYEENAFLGISSNAVLRVPSSLVDAYKADSKWTSAFGGGIVAI